MVGVILRLITPEPRTHIALAVGALELVVRLGGLSLHVHKFAWSSKIAAAEAAVSVNEKKFAWLSA
jgi:hypothetical protein